MTDKELKRLNRAELLEMLLAQMKESEELKRRLQLAQDKLFDRKIDIDNAGSIAEAALQINGVFEAAQQAATQYLENIEKLSGRQQEVCSRLEQESSEKTERMLSETKAKCVAMESETQKKCDAMVKNAELQTQKYWDDVSEKIERLVAEQTGLKELLIASGLRKKQE